MKKPAAMNPPAAVSRCLWAQSGGQLMHDYHDQEWGVPIFDDNQLFELLILEGAQAGLSWATVLNKRQNYRRAFANFVPQQVAQFSTKKIAALMQDSGLIRHRTKLQSAVNNAQCFLQTAQEFGSFSNYVWQFVNNKPIVGTPPAATTSAQATALAKDLQQRGFKFVGATIMHSYMQAAGLRNDHDLHCFRRHSCGIAK